MFGFGGDDKDDQRFWNMIVFKMYATDDEVEEMVPVILGVLGVVGVIALIVWGISKLIGG